MRRWLWIAALLACPAAGADGVDLSVKSKAIASAVAAKPQAPFVAPRDAWPPAIAPGGVEQVAGLRSACEHSVHDVCYDSTDGRIVYRPARRFMPRIGDLEPDGVSVRRDRIVFRYRF
ncbi:MAG TPA: hypothetical protein VLS49_15620 [Usitatibacter sp.]|nr:hypothetical protein [Usitatibacter sp.]